MKFISHRGNISYKKESLENNPNYLFEAVEEGFDIEFDLWEINSKLYLGHDAPQFEIDEKFLIQVEQKSWIHAKNINAASFLNETKFHWFWHENDKFTLTNKSIMWTYPGIFINNSIINQPELIQFLALKNQKMNFYGVCADNISAFKVISNDL